MVTLSIGAPSAAFADAFRPTRKLLVGGDGIALDEFLSQPVEHWADVVPPAGFHPN